MTSGMCHRGARRQTCDTTPGHRSPIIRRSLALSGVIALLAWLILGHPGGHPPVAIEGSAQPRSDLRACVNGFNDHGRVPAHALREAFVRLTADGCEVVFYDPGRRRALRFRREGETWVRAGGGDRPAVANVVVDRRRRLTLLPRP